MNYTVNMVAFYEPTEKREVTVPDVEVAQAETTEDLLERIFYYGQNDFQPRAMCSVSVADVVELNEELHMVAPMGFKKITAEQFEELKKLPQEQRTLHAYKISHD